MSSQKLNIIVLLLYFSIEFQSVHLSPISNRISTKFNLFELNQNGTHIEHEHLKDYYQQRQNFIDEEIGSMLGSDVKLNDKEAFANKVFMIRKNKEIEVGILYPFKFQPSRHIFEILDDIKKSKLLQLIQKMPKGGILHTHDTAMCTTNFVVNLTYWPNLWQRTAYNSNKIEEFRFSRRQPAIQSAYENSQNKSFWRLVEDVRNEMGAPNYDQYIRQFFTLFDKNVHPRLQYKDINDVWARFNNILDLRKQIITYAPIRKVYFKNALKEAQDDGVQYMEIRVGLYKMYDLDGNNYTIEDSMRTITDAIAEFKWENPTFIGAKLIYEGNKEETREETATYFENIRKLHEKFPQYLAGFDLSGQEDKAPPLVSFAEQILKLPKDIKLYLHAGETNWFGSTDENLIDAVLLGTRRIGHGFGLIKHPKVMELIKSKDIAVEVNPISNQVLKLVDDIRNHPAAVLLSQNIPIVISSDDVGLWEVSPLSHDFYYAFLGIASRYSDLRLLKKFAMNSIQYSAMNDTEKVDAFAKWQIQWDKFIDTLM